MNTLDWIQLTADARTQALTRPVQTVATQTREAVATLIADVRARGDVALREITARFDGVTLDSFAVSEAEFAAADAAIAPELRQAMQDAVARIDTFHRAGMSEGYAVETAPGVVCEKIVRPIGRVGLYVPAGSAPLPSTALMLGVPARLARSGAVHAAAQGWQCRPGGAGGRATHRRAPRVQARWRAGDCSDGLRHRLHSELRQIVWPR